MAVEAGLAFCLLVAFFYRHLLPVTATRTLSDTGRPAGAWQ
jgi:hypothetical protein